MLATLSAAKFCATSTLFAALHIASVHGFLHGTPSLLRSGHIGQIPVDSPLSRANVGLRHAIPTPRRSVAKSTIQMNAAALATRAAGGLATVASVAIEPVTAIIGAVVVAFVAWAFFSLNKPSREYKDGQNTVGQEYDAWTEEGLLEYYWGEHIHLGYYSDEDKKAVFNPLKSSKVFKDTKYRFIEEMYQWSDVEDKGKPAKVLDVGCGIGGTSRYLANKLGSGSQVTGISLSQNQVDRATSLAKERNLDNVNFQVMDALKMDFPDNSFDLVWGCESGEHMPDKKKYVEEMTRVCKPGGTVVIATWCEREPNPPITEDEQEKLDFLYKEWAHPYFISIEEYERLCKGTGKLEKVSGEDWVKETITAWRHSIWVGVWDPWIVIWKGFTSKLGPLIWWKTIREIVTLERMHKAFDCGLMTYGMIKAKKIAA